MPYQLRGPVAGLTVRHFHQTVSRLYRELMSAILSDAGPDPLTSNCHWEIILRSESPIIYSDFQDGWNRFSYQLNCQLPDSHATFDFRLNGSTQGLITLYHDPTGHYVLNFQQNNTFEHPYYAGISWEDPPCTN